MLGKCSTGLLGAFCLIACATTSWAQSHAEALKTFTAPGGAFSFRYSDQLIHCEQEKQKDGSYDWNPETCSAYIPVCDDTASATSIVCFAYPRNRFTNTQAFEAATFSVEVVHDRTTAKSCLAGPEAVQRVDKHGTAIVHGVSFKVFGVGDSGTGQGTEGDVYRTFHGGKCYQLGVNVATSDVATDDPPQRELTDADLHEINGTLEQARKSFRFLK
jgi:hypothetical protein